LARVSVVGLKGVEEGSWVGVDGALVELEGESEIAPSVV